MCGCNNNRPSREHDYVVHHTIVARRTDRLRPPVWVSPGGGGSGGGNVFSGTNLQFLAALATCTDRPRPTSAAAEGFSSADEGGRNEGCEKRREERQATTYEPTERLVKPLSKPKCSGSIAARCSQLARLNAYMREKQSALLCLPPHVARAVQLSLSNHRNL